MGKEKRAKSKKNGPLVIALETATVPQIVPEVIGDDTGDSVPRRRTVQRVPAQPQEIEDSDSDSDSDDSSSSSSSSLPNFQQLCQSAPGPLERAAEPPQFTQASPPASPEAPPKASEGIDVPVPMPVTIKGLSNEQQAEATPSPPEGEAEQLSFPKKPRVSLAPGSITFNMQGAQKAMAAARTRVQVQTAVEAAKAKRLNVRDAATQTVRDPERQDGDIVTIWRLRPRGMESFPHFAKQPKVGKRSNTKDLEAEVNVDPRDPSERKRARTAAEVKEVSIDVGGDDTGELSGGEAMFDPYQTTFDEEVAPDAAD